MAWKVEVWVAGFARPSIAANWTGPRKVIDGVIWYEYDVFYCETWMAIPARLAQVETAGLYSRLKMEIEEHEVAKAKDGDQFLRPVNHI